MEILDKDYYQLGEVANELGTRVRRLVQAAAKGRLRLWVHEYEKTDRWLALNVRQAEKLLDLAGTGGDCATEILVSWLYDEFGKWVDVETSNPRPNGPTVDYEIKNPSLCFRK